MAKSSKNTMQGHNDKFDMSRKKGSTAHLPAASSSPVAGLPKASPSQFAVGRPKQGKNTGKKISMPNR